MASSKESGVVFLRPSSLTLKNFVDRKTTPDPFHKSLGIFPLVESYRPASAGGKLRMLWRISRDCQSTRLVSPRSLRLCVPTLTGSFGGAFGRAPNSRFHPGRL